MEKRSQPDQHFKIDLNDQILEFSEIPNTRNDENNIL